MNRQTISRLPVHTVTSLPGVRVYPISGPANRGKSQDVLVVVDPGVEIPLHKHEGDAYMTIAGGTATVLSDDDANGRQVGAGFCVFYAAHRFHGFLAGPLGFSFISRNEGIVDDKGDWDMQFAPA